MTFPKFLSKLSFVVCVTNVMFIYILKKKAMFLPKGLILFILCDFLIPLKLLKSLLFFLIYPLFKQSLNAISLCANNFWQVYYCYQKNLATSKLMATFWCQFHCRINSLLVFSCFVRSNVDSGLSTYHTQYYQIGFVCIIAHVCVIQVVQWGVLSVAFLGIQIIPDIGMLFTCI